MKELLFGTAYYEEYLPYDRLAQDVAMMKKAGINTVRIAESTWSTCEPQEGTFDFSHVERVMDAMEEASIHVIIGTPTYAVPAWLARLHPDVLATTIRGQGIYGARQIMDITNPAYLYYGERIIRKLLEHTAHRKCVIGFQLDNETKYYKTAGKNVQERFVRYLREKFGDDLDALNREFGLDYWSNRINAWEDFPDVRGTVNGSLGAEFDKFRRTLVCDFLRWQTDIVKEYSRKEQFLTQNFDCGWRAHSFGVQPDVDQFQAAKAVSIAGMDIYHPSQDGLTGKEIAFGGDVARSLKRGNYLLMETQAQGYPDWTPYRGQLKLQAYSHIASGSNSVMYWHWHSIHNSVETYWKGILSHDFQENAVYREVCAIGQEFAKCGKRLVNLKKKNDVAILISNEALTALQWFGIQANTAGPGKTEYNDVVRWLYDALYEMNVECDFLWPGSEELEQYKVIVTPALYAAPDPLLERLDAYVRGGGTLIATFKTGFADEYVKVHCDLQPHILNKCMGVCYHQFAFPEKVKLSGQAAQGTVDREAKVFMEFLEPTGAETLLQYEHKEWGCCAAATKHRYGKGTGVYLGCMTSKEILGNLLQEILRGAGVPIPAERFPLIVRKGTNDFGKTVVFYLNYSGKEQETEYVFEDGTELPEGRRIRKGERIRLARWGVCIVETPAR